MPNSIFSENKPIFNTSPEESIYCAFNSPFILTVPVELPKLTISLNSPSVNVPDVFILCAIILCVFSELVLNAPDMFVIQFLLPIIIFAAFWPIVITPPELSMPPSIGTE